MDTSKLTCIAAWLMRVVMLIVGHATMFSQYKVSARSLPRTSTDTKTGFDESKDSSELSTLNDYLLLQRYIPVPPVVTLQITDQVRRHQKFDITLPLQPEMTVLHALVAAVRSHQDKHNNPFNVQLLWDDDLECYTIYKALGVTNTSTSKWLIRVRDWNKQVIYRDYCLPRDQVILRPFNRIKITYQSIKE